MDGFILLLADSQTLTVSNLQVPFSGYDGHDMPEPATFAYGVMGLLSVFGLKKKFGK